MKTLLTLCLVTLTWLSSTAQCVTSLNVTNVSCDSTCSAVIAVQFSGGALPLSVTLSDGMQTWGPFTVTSFFQYGNLCPGNYTLTAIDMNGDTCTGTSVFQILSSPSPDVSVVVTNATCTGCSDGAATATVTGGTPPYAYNWSNGATGGSVTGLAPGVYTVWATDVNGCWDLDTFLVGVGSGGYYAIYGQVYFDLNSNGAKDVGEPGVGNQSVLMTQGSVTAVTNSNGTYGFVVATGSYDISYAANPGWNLTSVPPSYNVAVTGSSVSGFDFGVYPDSAYASGAAVLTSNFPRCFWNIPYYLTIHNTGFTLLNGTVTFTHDPAMTYVSSTVTPMSHVGNVLQYAVSGLSPGQSVSIAVTLTEPAGGTAISNYLSASLSDGLGNQLSLSDTLNQVVNCSYDPNDKQVYPAGFGASHFVPMDTWLYYQVRFQNTGTDTAFKVVILDTLDNALDLSTFQLAGYSHPVDVTLRPGREVTFTFDNILLPDSNVNEPASHGYVLFRIRGLSSNPDPTVVNNTAYIYFDLNSPVVTNTTLTTFSDNFLFTEEPTDSRSWFELYPNPADEFVIIRLKDTRAGSFRVSLMDLQGRVLASPGRLLNNSLEIPIHSLDAGSYIIELISLDSGEPVHLRMVKR